MTEDAAPGRRSLFPPGIEPAALYRDRDVLGAALAAGAAAGWEVKELDAAAWADPERLHGDLATTFGFPEHYGRNLDALNDSLSDWAIGHQGSANAAPGCVIVLDRYDRFASEDPHRATIVLDIFITASGWALRHGWPLAIAIRSDDPELAFPPVAAVVVGWNPAERAGRGRRGRQGP